MNSPVRISAVSYLNTFPFVFGIQNSGELEKYSLELDIPSECARKLLSGSVDLALVPVGAIPKFKDPEIISDFCIGAEREVKTVILASRVPLYKIQTIALDYDSDTSVRLIRILAKQFWKITPAFTHLQKGQAEHPRGIESLVAIGDKTFRLVNEYPYVYDLAAEWVKFTSLPFVFAVWLATHPLPEEFTSRFNRALEHGIRNIGLIPGYFSRQIPEGVNALEYYRNNISFHLDEKKQTGMKLFLELLKNEE